MHQNHLVIGNEIVILETLNQLLLKNISNFHLLKYFPFFFLHQHNVSKKIVWRILDCLANISNCSNYVTHLSSLKINIFIFFCWVYLFHQKKIVWWGRGSYYTHKDIKYIHNCSWSKFSQLWDACFTDGEWANELF